MSFQRGPDLASEKQRGSGFSKLFSEKYQHGIPLEAFLPVFYLIRHFNDRAKTYNFVGSLHILYKVSY